MSQIEETLSRISKMEGVEGYVITDGVGCVLRQSKSFTDEVAASYAEEVFKLTKRARHFVRDLDPKNDLEFFRLRTKSSREILAAPGNNSLVIVVQVWRSTTEAAAAAAAQASAEAEGKVGGGH